MKEGDCKVRVWEQVERMAWKGSKHEILFLGRHGVSRRLKHREFKEVMG